MDSPPRTSKRNFMFMPSLKRLALVKIASTLWNQNDIRDLFSENYTDNSINIELTHLVEHRVIEKVSELLLPRVLGKLLNHYIHRVRSKILEWIDFHIVQCGYLTVNELPSEFFWTPHGNIDDKKVAETLVHDERLELYIRYKLACLYCLEESIILLWKELPCGFYEKPSTEAIVMFWSYYVAGEIYHLYNGLSFREEDGSSSTPFQFAFRVSVATGNEAGTRYFLPKLTLDERNEILASSIIFTCTTNKFNSYDKTCFSPCRYANNLCYLLSEMNEPEQTALLERYAAEVLDYFLNWPWQRLFLKTAKEIWCFLCQDDYYNLLQTIAEKKFSEAEIYNYQKLFGEFWQQGSADFKRHVILNDGLKSLSSRFFEIGDKENIKLIFEAATEQEREEFIFCPEGQEICRHLIEVGNWNLLKFFIQECTSKEVFHKLKEKVAENICFLVSCDVTKEDMLNEFYQLLFDVEQGNKRKCTDNEASLTSELHSSS